MTQDPISRRMDAEDFGEAERAQLAAMRRLAYHSHLMRIFGAVQQLVSAVEGADQAHQAMGLPDDAPLSEEERALFASSQLTLARLAQEHPGVRLLFPDPGEAQNRAGGDPQDVESCGAPAAEGAV
jgi:hypothetical protein